MLHRSNVAHASANSALGAPRKPGESRPDLFVGRSMGSILAESTAGAVFEIMEAPVMSVEGRKVQGIVFTDSGSNMNFITHDLAQKLMLEGANTKIFLKVIDKEYTEKEVKVYRIGVEDNAGRVYWMEAIGVESIMDSAKLQDEEGIRRDFPEIREGALRRPVGAAGLLISMMERQLHSSRGVERGKICLLQTP